jgi:putative ABC transport system permease protein
VITPLIGAAVGLPLGMFLGRRGHRLPGATGQLLAFTIVAVIAGVLAAIIPARRAAKLNVLRAPRACSNAPETSAPARSVRE